MGGTFAEALQGQLEKRGGRYEEMCRLDGIQCCSHCENLSCCDNTSEERKRSMSENVQTMVPMTFSQALERLKAGARVVNLNWNGKLQHLECQRPDELSKMKSPYIFIEFSKEHPNDAVRGKRVPWLASQLDLFSDDWVEVV